MSIEPFKHQYYAFCDGCTKELPFENDYKAILEAIQKAGWLIRIGKKREVLCKECRGGTK